ncbi:hypothetical protein DPMN_035223 [Dreissena polymorpha]|uniref:Uncharacterized protein n=1 Tax=Dreissena polymorpha TaxID=45954 RepID=A0A9D4RMS3_DREPO|nr:hypothetical protein DPMN_035223 [Dreissena polymorpha]
MLGRIAERIKAFLLQDLARTSGFTGSKPAPGKFIKFKFLPEGFLKADLTEDGQRNLVFGKDEAINYMADVTTWYVDGTFKCGREVKHSRESPNTKPPTHGKENISVAANLFL